MKLKKYGNKVGMEETQYNYSTSISLNTHVLILTSHKSHSPLRELTTFGISKS